MLRNWIKRIRIRRYSELLEEFLLHHKDCPVKEIRMVTESDADYDGNFNGLSYLYIHCENKDKQGNFYISVDKSEEASLWSLIKSIGIRAGYAIK